jgi:hypothetical protein
MIDVSTDTIRKFGVHISMAPMVLSLAKKNSYSQNFSIINQSLQGQTLLSVSKSMRKKCINEIQKQTIGQRLRGRDFDTGNCC